MSEETVRQVDLTLADREELRSWRGFGQQLVDIWPDIPRKHETSVEFLRAKAEELRRVRPVVEAADVIHHNAYPIGNGEGGAPDACFKELADALRAYYRAGGRA